MATGNDYLPLQHQMKESWTKTIQAIVSGAVVIVVMVVGGLALHLWTSFLFWHRWGAFWGFVSFFTPLAPEVVAVFACFWWHIQYYILAIALWLVSLGGMAFLEKDTAFPFRPALFIGWICLVGVLSVSFGHYAWRYSLGATSRTATDQAQLEDCAVAVVASLRASASDDPGALTDLLTGKKKLKETIRAYEKGSLDDLCSVVDQFLRYERSLQKDLLGYLADFRRNGGKYKFKMSVGTKQKLDKLPDKLRTALGAEEIGVDLMMKELSGGNPPDLPENWRELTGLVLARMWTIYGQTYSELLGRPMPQPAD